MKIGREYPTNLQWLEATTISQHECAERFGGLGRYVEDNNLCILTRQGKGVCSGDFGSPIVNTDNVCLGLISWTSYCATKKPDVASRVYPHLEFIRNATGIQTQ